ncbi:branched-chain amino acid aminotransferase [Candidatus Blochmanniella pennsylvanica str. BPEN]|uniref:Branched-chain-amino-acid aminotransferase n=1 Tax=Blochmanniella pennsylvanica (strain BPEN) TaxID=291272 RepID=Q491Y9_BLOPB|nr:branched-chain amino acid transaminase [Candidatus Blochmannia pennsylvanicus]AAZ41213.1 branched-chain amino acid aminotransferase [Candidatus Blochmannia pennsylvanicus str. BPEN]UOY04402.1 branched-chain amino acid transaminase [Candidatus Blochmannia pennsylvanicus]
MNISNFIWFNGEIVPWQEAKVHVMSHALHYGSSVFEGMRCYNSHKGPVIFRHREHIQRLYNSAKIYRMPIFWSIDDLMEACRIIIRKNNLINAYIRPLVFIGNVGMQINPTPGYATDVAIAAFSWLPYLGENSLKQGIDVMVSSWNRVPANTLPSTAKAGGNYLSSMLISNEAHRNGYQEGIGLDIYGYISEGAGENLFEVKSNILLTPPCASSILPGVTRDTIIKLAVNIGLEVQEQVLPRESLYIADEIFMSGTAAEITPVRTVDGIKVGTGTRGPITKKLQHLFFNLFTGITEDQWNWLDPVH